VGQDQALSVEDEGSVKTVLDFFLPVIGCKCEDGLEVRMEHEYQTGDAELRQLPAKPGGQHQPTLGVELRIHLEVFALHRCARSLASGFHRRQAAFLSPLPE
jgi:hypothetical protein